MMGNPKFCKEFRCGNFSDKQVNNDKKKPNVFTARALRIT